MDAAALTDSPCKQEGARPKEQRRRAGGRTGGKGDRREVKRQRQQLTDRQWQCRNKTIGHTQEPKGKNEGRKEERMRASITFEHADRLFDRESNGEKTLKEKAGGCASILIGIVVYSILSLSLSLGLIRSTLGPDSGHCAPELKVLMIEPTHPVVSLVVRLPACRSLSSPCLFLSRWNEG
mmetsp:Transcript_26206/g.51456  ORF Transcript_26206/g.51456 Transcript_26206/m.51456 type:complete len:180 (-) Transcript_26206:607-1146(-)